MDELMNFCHQKFGDTYELQILYSAKSDIWEISVQSPLLTQIVLEKGFNYGQPFEKLSELSDQKGKAIVNLKNNLKNIYVNH